MLKQLAQKLGDINLANVAEAGPVVDEVIAKLREIAAEQETRTEPVSEVDEYADVRTDAVPAIAAVYFVVGSEKHRGYRDASGRFTLEQCNLSKANRADNLVEIAEGADKPEGFDDLDECGHCFS